LLRFVCLNKFNGLNITMAILIFVQLWCMI